MIGKYLDICTSHLNKATLDQVNYGDIEGVFSYEYPEGTFIVVPDAFEQGETPKDLERVLEYARHNGVSLIRLDRDGEEIEELPTYDW